MNPPVLLLQGNHGYLPTLVGIAICYNTTSVIKDHNLHVLALGFDKHSAKYTYTYNEVSLFAISSLSSLVCSNCPHQVYFTKFRPEYVHKYQFAVGALPN